MNDKIYTEFALAKKSNNLVLIKKLYEENKNNSKIKFAYAKILIIHNKIVEGKVLFEELLNTPSRNYALLELGRLEVQEGNHKKAKEYFIERLNNSESNIDRNYVLLELGKLEVILGNHKKAKEYFIERLNNSKNNIDRNYALQELGKLEVILGNIQKAKEYFVERLNNSESIKDKSYALLELGRIEAEEGNIEQARIYFKQSINKNSSLKDKSYIINLLILCDLEEEKYVAALNKLKKLIKHKVDIDYKLLYYVCKKLNISTNGKNEKFDKSINEVLKYNKCAALDHVVRNHRVDIDDFNPNVNIFKLFDDIKKYLTEENRIPKLIFYDIYVVPYNNIGFDGQNYLLVVTLPKTKNIITMYPVKDKYNISFNEQELLNRNQKKKSLTKL